jgi:hypothetical protein
MKKLFSFFVVRATSLGWFLAVSLAVSIAPLSFLPFPRGGHLLIPEAWAIDPADVDAGTTADYVDVASATVGVRIGPSAIKTALRVQVKTGAASPVCFNYVDRTASCATALTDPDTTGFCLPSGGAYVFPVAEEHFRGQVCAINFTSGTSRVGWNAW